MERTRAERIINGLVIIACFSLLAWLNGRYVGQGAGQVALYTILGLLIAILGLAGLAGLILVNPAMRQAGYPGAVDAVSRAYLLALPFALLALLADLAFGWNAATAFMQAAIMTSGAAVGVEVMRRSGQKVIYMIIPMAGAFAFSIIWIAYSAVFSKAVG